MNADLDSGGIWKDLGFQGLRFGQSVHAANDLKEASAPLQISAGDKIIGFGESSLFAGTMV